MQSGHQEEAKSKRVKGGGQDDVLPKNAGNKDAKLIVDEWRENKRVSFIFRSTVNAGVNDDGII